MEARIFDIKRFAVHDGDGIRTTVFLKGCSLKCIWCHNPEGILFQPQIAYYENKCLSCGECVQVCEHDGHTLTENIHLYNRGNCNGCGACVPNCPGAALAFYGKKVTVDELLPLLLEDRVFYETSNGGVTISGGECLMQADFCAELLKRLKEEGIPTAVDTCGFVPKESFDKVIPYTDVFLYDIKAFDVDVHIRCTGQSNTLILNNLMYLDSLGKHIEIRIPYVPGYNEDQMEKIAAFVKTLHNVEKVKVLPYHNYAGSKYAALGMVDTLPQRLPDKNEVSNIQALFDR